MSTPTEPQVSRRDALHLGLLAGAGLLLAAAGTARSEDSNAPLTKVIPSSGERIPVVGLGTDRFSDAPQPAIQAEIQRMHELGGRLIDTAAAYGESEAKIGEALAALGIRDQMFIATKLTASGTGMFGRTPHGRESFERSLQALRTPRIDLLQVHNLDGVDELMPQLMDWKGAGKIRYIGITTSRVAQHAAMAGYMRRHPLDFVQVDYSLANRDAAGNVLPLALERRIAVLANVPFGFGTVLRQAQSRKLPPWAADLRITSWSQLLLKYVISHPAVTCAIPGSTQVAHLEENQGAARGPLPDEAMRRRMEQLWDAA
jgi:aryl-alcohol dehydrogenase-like predicted oxidoreductase